MTFLKHFLHFVGQVRIFTMLSKCLSVLLFIAFKKNKWPSWVRLRATFLPLFISFTFVIYPFCWSYQYFLWWPLVSVYRTMNIINSFAIAIQIYLRLFKPILILLFSANWYIVYFFFFPDFWLLPHFLTLTDQGMFVCSHSNTKKDWSNYTFWSLLIVSLCVCVWLWMCMCMCMCLSFSFLLLFKNTSQLKRAPRLTTWQARDCIYWCVSIND